MDPTEPGFATTRDGVRLALRRFRAVGERRAVVCLVHAMMANARYLDRPAGAGFASSLAAAGVEAWTLELRGHGASIPPRPGPSGWGIGAYAELDLPAALAAIAAEAGVAPTAIDYLGHSLGGLSGLVAFAGGTAPPPRRLVLVATNVWRLRGTVSVRRRAQLWAMETSARLVGRVAARAFRVGTDDEPAPYIREILQWTRTSRWPWDDALASIPSPALIVSADGDGWCRPHEARAFAERLGGPLTHRVVGRVHGDAAESDHFGFFTDRRQADRLWIDIAEFLARA